MSTSAIALFALLRVSPGAIAREQDAAREMEAHETVVHFLELLGGLRFYALEQYMTEDANIVVARWSKSGFVNRVQTAREWLDGLMEGPAPQPFREELTDVGVDIASGELATVRAEFEIVRDTKVASFGVDFFTLIRRDDRWKIASIAYTSIPASEREKN